MDNTDCWINEFDFKSLTLPTGFVSPGPSSGYCSSEESYNQLKASNGSYDSKDRVFKQRQSESFLSHADAFGGVSSLDLANFGTCGDLTEVENNVFELGNTPPNFDDLMDTLWNPINADFSSLDCITDSDISDASHSSGMLSLTSGCNDPGLTQFASTANGAQRYPAGKPGWQKRAASPSKEEPYLVKKPSNPSLSAGSAAAISAESRNRLKRVFDFQRQVAGLADMMVGDEDEYILQFAPSSSNKLSHRVAESEASFMAVVTAAPTPAAQGSALLGGVFSQRGTVPAPFKNCETRALARVHGGTVSSPCGTLLRHSASVPNSVKSAAVAGNGTKDGAMAQRSGGSRLQNSSAGQHPCTRGDMKGGRANALALALDDHRYTLKPSHSPPVPRNARGRKTSAGTSTQNVQYPRRMSILEAFLRSTRPLDPNKGSNAALAAEGLAHLRIETDVDDDDDNDDDDDFRTSGTILKKLLTGEIDQSEVHRCEQRVIRERVSSCSALATAEPVLADDFGLGAELLLSDSDASNLLCDELASGGLWMNAEIGDETFSSELDEILREQTRQDNLWLRHYIDCL